MTKKKVQYVALLISILLIAIISLANMQTVTVNSLVTFLVSLPKDMALKNELKSAKKQLGQKMAKEEKVKD